MLHVTSGSVRLQPDAHGPAKAGRYLLVLLLAMAIASCGGKKEEEAAPVVTVDVAPVLLSKIQRTIRADGLLYPKQQAAIVPKIAAPIKRTYVQRGTRVRAGQPLVELENQDLEGAATESRAALTQAEATFETTSKATVPEELQKAELDEKAAQEAANAEQAVFDSRQRLYREGAIAQKDVNDAQVALSQARTQYETARKHLDDLRSFANQEALKAAAAQRDAARGRNESVQAQLSYSRITSPIDGVITDLPFYPGETPPAGAPVVTVMDVSRVIARTHVSQSDASEIAVGDDASLIGQGGVPIPAKVTQLSPALDSSSSTVEVWIEADNKGGQLRPGSSIRVEIVTKTVPNALVIPQQAVMTTPQGATFAVLIDKDNKPHLRKIAVGIRDAGKTQVTDGLSSGDRVATTGAYELFRLDPDVLEKTKVQIAPTKEEEEPEES
ncbi:MAG TPA: efflux RND transporter periplasmic adaptor subunit [Vicinamibacterales bacterium]|nr:efflux RND transporter periplasmic adaptor subunit [Vicinamibacterales bacterium]